jgi:hypothetical protein
MFNKRRIHRQKIKAVHDDDLEQFLASLGILEKLKEGRLYCSLCRTQITMENIGVIQPKDNEINLICNRISCLSEVEVDTEERDV